MSIYDLRNLPKYLTLIWAAAYFMYICHKCCLFFVANTLRWWQSISISMIFMVFDPFVRFLFALEIKLIKNACDKRITLLPILYSCGSYVRRILIELFCLPSNIFRVAMHKWRVKPLRSLINFTSKIQTEKKLWIVASTLNLICKSARRTTTEKKDIRVNELINICRSCVFRWYHKIDFFVAFSSFDWNQFLCSLPVPRLTFRILLFFFSFVDRLTLKSQRFNSNKSVARCNCMWLYPYLAALPMTNGTVICILFCCTHLKRNFVLNVLFTFYIRFWIFLKSIMNFRVQVHYFSYFVPDACVPGKQFEEISVSVPVM